MLEARKNGGKILKKKEKERDRCRGTLVFELDGSGFVKKGEVV